MNTKLINNVLIAVAIILVIVGLRFASVGVGPGHLMQDDGYSVTGSVMTFAGGFLLGRLIYMKAKNKEK